MDKYPDFWSVLIGKGNPGFFWGFVVISLICAMVMLLIHANSRDISSERTPVKFSTKFLLADNILRILVNLLLVPITIRLVYEYVPPTAMLFLSVGIGFGSDGLCMLAQRIGLLTTNKLANNVLKKIEEKANDGNQS
jgi:uncharacterized BrkB/YihY/UPF0761 family membrane protein